MRFSSRSRLGLFFMLLLVFATGLSFYTSSRGAVQAAGPQIWLSQKVGPPTASMQVYGKGFGLNETVLVYFDDTRKIGSTTTDATGHFVRRVTVPKTALPGTHTVRATGQSSGLTALALFLVRTDWTQFGFGPSRTGYNPYENVLTSSNVSALTLDWSHPNQIDTSPAVANGVVYVGSGDTELYALDAVTGTRKWSHATGGAITTSPAVANGVVYFGSKHKLYALDAVTGALKWSYTTGGPFSPTLNFTSPAIANGVVYICDYEGVYSDKLYALDAATGSLRWSITAGACSFSSPAIAKGVIYVCGGIGLEALDAATGTLKWGSARLGICLSGPTVVNGVVYTAGQRLSYPFTSVVEALDAATGTCKWSSPTGTFFQASLAVANGVVYFSSDSVAGKLYALDAATGTRKWSSPTGDFDSFLAVANGVVYVFSNSLYALDAATGTRKWSYPTGSITPTSPAVVNGVVYAVTDPAVYAFHLPGMS